MRLLNSLYLLEVLCLQTSNMRLGRVVMEAVKSAHMTLFPARLGVSVTVLLEPHMLEHTSNLRLFPGGV